MPEGEEGHGGCPEGRWRGPEWAGVRRGPHTVLALVPAMAPGAPARQHFCPLSVSVCHTLVVVSSLPHKGPEDCPPHLAPPRPWGPALQVPADRLTNQPLPRRYAMKCLDKKRIKMKQGETLALNERIMLSLVSTGVSGQLASSSASGSEPGTASADLLFHPFLGLPLHRLHVVRVPHARQAQLHPGSHERWVPGLAPGGPQGWGPGWELSHPPDRLLPSGGDLHYHLSQHGVFSEADMRFYAAEIILGLEHMHNRFVVYRDLKVRCPALLPARLPPFPR